ncbi:thioredoxin-like protein AAED1, chloroplastic [Selaginella moellendorffii]|nr:thioredoxin-like protein AAED1, chloroplastic [Selaginella moellendorffii]|eukprot:XP_002977235.2 thioredoxin-like protein AAED1, chloroplastic [Selaginella moellendorffii]
MATVLSYSHNALLLCSAKTLSADDPARGFLSRRSICEFRWEKARPILGCKRRWRGLAAAAAAADSLMPGISTDASVLDLSGNVISLTDLWKDRTAVVAFARHFGCILCRKRADVLASKKEVFDGAGVSLVLVGPGTVDQAKAFASQTQFPGEVYADPTHASFEAFQFVSGASTIFNPKAAMRVMGAHLEGYRQDWGLSFEKDTVQRGGWQQGGIVIAGPGKDRLLYVHKDKEAGDEPDIKEVIEACCEKQNLS